jgi:hypothetical protein
VFAAVSAATSCCSTACISLGAAVAVALEACVSTMVARTYLKLVRDRVRSSWAHDL